METTLVAKRCKMCSVLKESTEFTKNSATSDGHKSWCRGCCVEHNLKYRLENPGKEKARKARWRVENPDKEKASKAKYNGENSEKMKAIWAKYRLENPSVYKASNAKWKRENKIAVNAMTQARRARILGAEGRYTKEDWNKILDFWGHKCAGCNCVGPLAVDHIVSLNMGGSNWPSNLQPLCQPCNSSKGAKSFSFIKPI